VLALKVNEVGIRLFYCL